MTAESYDYELWLIALGVWIKSYNSHSLIKKIVKANIKINEHYEAWWLKVQNYKSLGAK